MFKPTVNMHWETKKKYSSSDIYISHQPVQKQALASSTVQRSLAGELQTMAGSCVQRMQTSQRPWELVTSVLTLVDLASVFSSHRFKLYVSAPTEGKISSSAASWRQIPTQNVNGGSHDLQVQPERDAASLGPMVVLGRQLISPPGHSP